MAPSELPKDVQLLLAERIRSIEQLEILLLLREEPQRAWDAAEVYRRVRSNERSVEQTLGELARRGFFVRTDGAPASYQYAPLTPALAETVRTLAHLYAERRVRIVEAIYSDRVSEVDEFARAFRLRKDTNG